MTVVDVTGEVLGGCCQVMLTLVLVFRSPLIVEVTFLERNTLRVCLNEMQTYNVLCTILTRGFTY